MQVTTAQNNRIARLTFTSVYPHYRDNVEKKRRSQVELNEVITWLTGFDKSKIQALIREKVTFKHSLTKPN